MGTEAFEVGSAQFCFAVLCRTNKDNERREDERREEEMLEVEVEGQEEKV